jgi:hypothetical protein
MEARHEMVRSSQSPLFYYRRYGILTEITGLPIGDNGKRMWSHG